jgi:Tol biopolymer transport system component
LKAEARPFAHANVRSFAIARSGHRLVYPQVVNDSNVWRIALSDDVKPASAPEELIASTLRDQNAPFSVDGSTVLFETDRSGQSEFWIARSDGANRQPLVRMADTEVGTRRWSCRSPIVKRCNGSMMAAN